MSDIDRGFVRLQHANPAPSVVVEDRPTALVALAVARSVPRGEQQRPTTGRGLLVAAAAFGMALAVSIPVLMFLSSSDESGPPATAPAPSPLIVVPTTQVSTTATSTVPDQAAAIDATTQILLDTFIVTYNSGDVDAFMDLLHPDFERLITVERDERPSPLETVRIRQEIEAALNTHIILECSPVEGGAACMPERSDDLHRVLNLPPTTGPTWFLRFQGGLLHSWSERRSATFGSEYERIVTTPFLEWVSANRPEIPYLFPSTGGGWLASEGIADTMAILVGEWAASLGVSLDE